MLNPRGVIRFGVLEAGILPVMFAGLLAAQSSSPFEKTIPTTAAPRVSVSNLGGRIVVRGWERTQIHARYQPSSAQMEVDYDQIPLEGRADKVHFITRALTGAQADSPVDYTLEVPNASSLEIHNPYGSVRIQAILGSASVDSIAGTVSLDDVTGHLSVQTVGGDIDVIGQAGRVETYSTNGNLHFINLKANDVKANTTTGDIVYQGDFQPGGRYVLTDYSGNIEILCLPTDSFELTAKTVKGRVENTFRLVSARRFPSALGRGNSLMGRVSTGQATLEVSSFSGTIRIHPQP